MYTEFKIVTEYSKSTHNTGCCDSKFNYQFIFEKVFKFLMTISALSSNIFMHCTEVYLQVEEYPRTTHHRN